jgi:hypothetical protein
MKDKKCSICGKAGPWVPTNEGDTICFNCLMAG